MPRRAFCDGIQCKRDWPGRKLFLYPFTGERPLAPLIRTISDHESASSKKAIHPTNVYFAS